MSTAQSPETSSAACTTWNPLRILHRWNQQRQMVAVSTALYEAPSHSIWIRRGEVPREAQMIRKALFASMIALGTIGAAQAQDAGPRLIGTGDNAQLVHPMPSRNLVGGGVAVLTGTGDDAQLVHGGPLTAKASALIVELVGTGDDARLVYYSPAAGNSLLAANRSRPRR
jgi:hypothetical protein